MYQYIARLSHKEAVDITWVLLNTFLALIVGLGCYFVWEVRQSQQPPKKEIDHFIYEYGTKESIVEIHYFANPTIETFVRYIRTLMRMDATYDEIQETCENILQYMKTTDHTNLEDMYEVIQFLLDPNTQEEQKEAAEHWLRVACTFWMIHPLEPMIPFLYPVSMEVESPKGDRSQSF